MSEAGCHKWTWLFSASVASDCFLLNVNLLPLNAFSDPHIWPTIEKKPLCSVLESSKTYDCGPFVDRKLYKLSIPLLNTTAQMACLMIIFLFWKDVSIYFDYYTVWNWNLKARVACPYINYQRCCSKNKFRSDAWHCNDDVHIIQKLIFMGLWADIMVAKVYQHVMAFVLILLNNFTSHSLNMTADRCTLSWQYLHSPRVLCLSSGYRGQKGERGQLGLGLPGDPGHMGPPGKNSTKRHGCNKAALQFFLYKQWITWPKRVIHDPTETYHLILQFPSALWSVLLSLSPFL